MAEISNTNLTEKDLPPPNADWTAISEFALTFNGYDHWESFEKCAKIANDSAAIWHEKRILPNSLIDLRTSLFFEQRRWRHYGYDPDEETMVYIHALVEAIRSRVQNSGRN